MIKAALTLIFFFENSRAGDPGAIKWTVEEKDILACINQIISGRSDIIGSVENLYHVSDWISVTSNNICWELFACKKIEDKHETAVDNNYYHVPGGSETNSHPSQSLSLHVDVKDPRITSVGVNSNKSGAIGHVASFWGAEGQAVIFWISHL